jgi:hypothetical protein
MLIKLHYKASGFAFLIDTKNFIAHEFQEEKGSKIEILNANFELYKNEDTWPEVIETIDEILEKQAYFTLYSNSIAGNHSTKQLEDVNVDF